MGVSRSVHGTFQRARHGILEVKLEAVPSTIWPRCAVASYNKNDPTKRGRVVASRGDTGCVCRGVRNTQEERAGCGAPVGRAYLVVIRVLHRLLPYCPKSHRACPRLRRRRCFTAPPPKVHLCRKEGWEEGAMITSRAPHWRRVILLTPLQGPSLFFLFRIRSDA